MGCLERCDRRWGDPIGPADGQMCYRGERLEAQQESQEHSKRAQEHSKRAQEHSRTAQEHRKRAGAQRESFRAQQESPVAQPESLGPKFEIAVIQNLPIFCNSNRNSISNSKSNEEKQAF